MAEALAEEKILSRYAVEIDGDCMPVTSPSGDRVYAKMQTWKMGVEGLKKTRTEKIKDGLLSDPISDVIRKLDQDTFSKASLNNRESSSHATQLTVPIASEQLWVEKYAPCSFTELLSDEQTNREVLFWLKQWDSCVFGSQFRATTDDVVSALRHHSSAVQHQKTSDRRSFSVKGITPFSSQYGKPLKALDRHSDKVSSFSELWSKKSLVDPPHEQKVLLLCGPPGLGKTTLAHVAAKHCGYQVIEINASDDRSSSTIESKILGVVQMNSVTVDSKPKCLVIDEIDGALGEGKGAVDVILKMVVSDKKNSGEKEGSCQKSLAEKNPSKKGHKFATLLRPVICICNDLYAPALRPLRQIARVHMFAQPTICRVVNRLKYICHKEGFKTNSIALAALVEYTECDIRSCLNTLQFLNKKKETLHMFDIGSQVVGRKDVSRSCVDIWKEVFQKRKPKREKRSANLLGGNEDLEHMYSLISSRGDYELTMDGIHENLLRLPYHDPMMQKTVRCLDMVAVSDLLHQYIMRTQQMSLYVYQPPVTISISRIVARVEKPNIEWPKSLQRARAMFMERKDILKLWQNKISPIILRHLTFQNFAEDFVSFFLHVLAPPTLRPVALHLLSERERDDLAKLVNTMVCYSVTYKNSKVEHLQGPQNHGATSDIPMLSLDPPIHIFVNFKDYQPVYLELSLAMKQVLVHEVEKKRILLKSLDRSLFASRYRKGSNIDSKIAQNIQKVATAGRDSRPFLFKYNEGFTNAVRRPVKIRELLL
ncbi:hypothetical protein AXF42_Ash021053 [Apostasia shenzhenica]|uniref:Chromosome transmission fidelity protein 18 homolog n=1 Tax=Apostasia shenzhenica TaxID=1088818 RepID=A0A2H9ZZC6_9ASPA|nr:hypothetical protein AXF42_Ash021053 [Apostasia shenzhenica]